MNHPREVRQAVRARRHTGHTAGLAPGHVLVTDLENRSLAES